MKITAQDALGLADSIKPLLAGHPAVVQGAALANLLALWLAGHYAPGKSSEALCASLLAFHVESVGRLVAIHIDELKAAGLLPKDDC